MNLHAQIMNIPLDNELIEFLDAPATKAAYRVGHRDARHDAAELAMKYDALFEELEDHFGKGIVDVFKRKVGL